jgi:PAS domain S-box-containing protein
MPGKMGKTILLVDDEAIIAMAEADMLEKHGYTVLTAYTGEQAIKAAAENPSLDLILMDIDLGSGMDGTEAASIILQNMDIPVLFLSSHTEPEMVEKTEKITSYGYVVKNSGETVLLASIRMAFKLHAAHRELRKREEALGKSENKLALIFENTPNAITITEVETGLVVEANKGIEWTGWSRGEIIGKNLKILQSWINPGDEEKIATILKASGKLTDYRIDFYKKDGSIAHSLMNSVLIKLDGRQYLLTISNDITRLIETEGELRQAKEELERTNEELNETVEELKATNKKLQATNEELEESKNDLETLLAEHNRALNTLREKEYFLRKSQEIGKTGSFNLEFLTLDPVTIRWSSSPVMDAIIGIDDTYPRTRESWLALLVEPEKVLEYIRDHVFRKKENFDLTYQIKRYNDGEIRWIHGLGEPQFDERGNIARMIGTGQDITERKKADDALRESEENYRTLVSNMQDTLYRCNSKGDITFVSPSGVQLLGHDSVEELLGKNIAKDYYYNPDERVMLLDNLKKHGKVTNYEVTLKRKDGSPVNVSTNSQFFFDKNGNLLGIEGIFNDITQRKQAERKLQENEERLRGITANIPGVVYQFYAKENGEYGISYTSDRITELFGIPADTNNLFPAFLENVYEKDRDRFLDSIKESVETCSPWNFEGRFIKPSGEMIWFNGLSTPTLHDDRLLFDGIMLNITERKRAEEALMLSEDRFSDLVRFLPETVFEADRQGGITFVNQTGLKQFGYTQNDIDRGLNVINIIIPQDHKRAIETMGKVIQGESTGLNEYTALKKNGTEFPVLVHSSAIIRDGKPEGFRGFLADITRLKQMEEVLDEEKIFTEAVLDSVPGLLYLYDEEGHLQRWNKSHETLTGYTQEELAGMNIYDWFKHDRKDLAIIKTGVERAFREGYANAEGNLMIKSGKTIPYYFTAKLLEIKGKKYIVGIGLNITARKQALEALRESEERWQFALEGAGDGMWDWNTETDRVYFSHQWKTMIGYDDHEISDSLSEWDSRLHPDDRDRVNAELNRHFDGTTAVYTSEHRLRCKNGNYKWFLDRGKVISRTPEGKPLRVLGTHTDINDRKNIEEKLELAVSEKESLLRELQHRMKNSLAMISGIINLEIERINDRELRNVFDNIKGRIESLSSLYSLLFQSETVREVDLGTYIRSIVGLLSDSYGAGKNIKISQFYDPIWINTKNAAAWGLIINELLTNSFKYAFPLGRPGTIRINLRKTGGGIILTVSDTGAGLPEDFDIVNPPGLGLLLVKTLTKQLRGILSFERGEENTFSVRAPDLPTG